MTHARENFLAWLRQAHAMEEHAVTLLTAQVRRIENYPDLGQRIADHLAETVEHEKALRQLLEHYCGGASTIKDVTARIAAAAHGVQAMLTNDEVIKGVIAGYAFEHSQIATYRVLIAAADELDEEHAVAVFERILAEETAMAAWLGEHLDAITRIFLMRDERDLLAKR